MLEEIAGEMLRTLEHQVLEEVREPPLVPLFILGAYMVPEIYGDEREAMLASEDHVEAVVQGHFREVKAW